MRTTLPIAALLASATLFARSFEVASVRPAASSAGQRSMNEDAQQAAYSSVPPIVPVMRA
jgi:hypothetical protein